MKPIFYYDNWDDSDDQIQDYFMDGWKYDDEACGIEDDILKIKVTPPSGKIWTLENCIKILQKPEQGNENQLEALEVLKYYNVLSNWMPCKKCSLVEYKYD